MVRRSLRWAAIGLPNYLLPRSIRMGDDLVILHEFDDSIDAEMEEPALRLEMTPTHDLPVDPTYDTDCAAYYYLSLVLLRINDCR